MPHRRSDESYARRMKTWEEWRFEKDLPNRIVLNYSFHDLENGEVVFTYEMEAIVRQKLKEAFDGGEDMYAEDHEFGDVLNRFPLRVQQRIMKYHGWPIVGSFQK